MEHDIRTGHYCHEISYAQLKDACLSECLDPDTATVVDVTLDGTTLTATADGPVRDHLVIECVSCGAERTHASSYLRDHQVPGYVYKNFCTACRENGDEWYVDHVIAERVDELPPADRERRTVRFTYELSRDRFEEACRDYCIDPDTATVAGMTRDGNLLTFDIEGSECDHLALECVTCGTRRTHASSYLRDHQVPGYVFGHYCTTCRENGDGWLVDHVVVERVEIEDGE